MPSPFRIPIPKKGINRNLAFSDQNGMQQGFGAQLLPETTVNALNVFPYDLSGRLRPGQRPGTAHLFSAIGSGTSVNALGVSSIALDPASAPASFVLIDDKWTEYANGVSLNTGTVWGVASTLGVANNADYLVNNAGSGTAFLDHIQADTTSPRVYYAGPAITLGSTYEIDVTFVWGGTDATELKHNVYFRAAAGPIASATSLQVQMDTSSTSNITGTTIIGLGPTGGGFDTFASVSTFNPAQGDTFVISVLVQGNVITVKLNGVTVLGPFTETTLATQSGFGFSINGITGGTNPSLPHSKVNEIKVLTGQVSAYRQTFLVAMAAGNIYGGSLSGVAQASGGSAIVPVSIIPSLSFGQGNCYVAGGTNPTKLILASNTASTLTATAGTVPTSCTITTVWRDRLVFAAPPATPQNFFFSRVGTHTDFDYSQSDPAAAFAGSASTAGHIGDPITALMPFNDDVMMIGGDHHLWRVSGDPADGGSIDLISDAIGVYSNTAWTKDPSGNIYFVGTGGLYRVAPNGQPENLTQTTFAQFFSALNRAGAYINLVWDRDNFGLYIFATPTAGATLGVHLYYDARNGGFWQLQFPQTHGPVSAVVYDDSSPLNRVVLLGGLTGLIQQITTGSLNDDGTAISSTLTLGPFQPAAPAGDAIVSMMDVALAESQSINQNVVTFNANWTLAGGKTASEAYNAPRHIVSGSFTSPGYQNNIRQRLRGGWFTLTISNATLNTYWAMEHAVLHVEGQGRQR